MILNSGESVTGHYSDKDTSKRASQINGWHINKSYEELKKGSHRVKTSEKTLTCPYCPGRKRDYKYNELLNHALGVGQSDSQKRSVVEKANHLALVKYLEKDLINVEHPTEPVNKYLKKDLMDVEHPTEPANKYLEHPTEPANEGSPVNSDKRFVWPWTGIVVNIPTRQTENGRCFGESGSKLRDEYRNRGFNPNRVRTLWDDSWGHSGAAVVEFNKSWLGLHNALAFERAYELDHHGKKDWFAHTEKSGLYAWVARADDYEMNNIIGEQLQKMGNVKMIPELMEDEARRLDKLVSSVNGILQVKNKQLKEMETICSEITLRMDIAVGEIDRLTQAHSQGIY